MRSIQSTCSNILWNKRNFYFSGFISSIAITKIEIFVKIRGLFVRLTSLTMEQAKYYKKTSITKQILNYMIIQSL